MRRLPLLLPVAICAALLTGLQLALSAAGLQSYLNEAIIAAYHAIVVLGLCLLMGYAGQISLGHGAFFALGGYTSAVLTTAPLSAARDSGWVRGLRLAGALVEREDLYGAQILTVAPGAAFLAALLLTLAVALLIGYPALRLRGHYLAMATLGFGLIVYRLLLGTDWTGSADGISNVPPWHLGCGLTVSGRPAYRVQNFYIAWGLCLLTLALLLRLAHSRIGRALRAIHEHEAAADAMGIPTAALKLRVFVLSALLAAGAGSLLTHYHRGIYPSAADATQSVRYVALVAAGGMANLWGALLVSATLNFLSLRGVFGSYDHAVFGALLILIVSLAPQGPFQPLAERLARRRRARKEAAHGAA